MGNYILRRLLQAIPTFFGITILSYMLMTTAGNPVQTLAFGPGDSTAEQARLAARLGVNDAWPVQYLRWLLGDDWMRWDSNGDGISDHAFLIPLDADGDGIPDPPGTNRGVVRGDFGLSFVKKRPALDILFERLPATLELSITSLILGLVAGLSIGILAAINHRKWFDLISRVLAVVFDSIPVFWLSLMLLMVFAAKLNVLPMGDRCQLTTESSCPPIWDRWQYMVLPVFVLSTGLVAGYSRYMRASMLDVLGQDYIRTARAKGLRARRIWFVHAAKNAMIPIATFLGPALTGLLGGALIVESIFNYPGVGRTAYEAAISRDYPLVMVVTIYAAIATIVGYLLSDVLYGLIDPRISFQ